MVVLVVVVGLIVVMLVVVALVRVVNMVVDQLTMYKSASSVGKYLACRYLK